MATNSGKLAVGLLLLISVWVGVYWMYEPSKPPITMDRATTGVNGPIAPPLMQVEPQTPIPPEAQRVQRAEAPAPTPAVQPPEFIDYIVQTGDTFDSISIRFYGSPHHTDAITRANGLGDAARLLTPGRTIRIAKDPTNLQGKPFPSADPFAQTAPSPHTDPPPNVKAPRTYAVQSGDSLSKIAKRFYDDASQWEKIYEANKAKMKGPHDLKVGAVLVIPD
jgi:nucleoid-associated protein YgaU